MWASDEVGMAGGPHFCFQPTALQLRAGVVRHRSLELHQKHHCFIPTSPFITWAPVEPLDPVDLGLISKLQESSTSSDIQSCSFQFLGTVSWGPVFIDFYCPFLSFFFHCCQHHKWKAIDLNCINVQAEFFRDGCVKTLANEAKTDCIAGITGH